MDAKLAILLILQITATVFAADTSYSKYYSNQPSQPPSPPASYSYSPPSSYSPPTKPASYPSYGQQPSYSPPTQAYSYPASYNQASNYGPGYPNNLASNYGPGYPNNQAFNYGPGYPNNLAFPYSPTYQAMGYPTGYGPYGSYPSYSNEYANCTDQLCPADQCCEFNGRKYVCVPQATGASIPTPGAVCTRFKRCYSNGDCPSGHCCVMRLDTINDYSYSGSKSYGGSYGGSYSGSYGGSYSGSYNSYGGNYNGVYKTERGECLLAGAPSAECRKPVEGSASSTCPCATAGNVCKFTSANPLVGLCGSP
ncbi:prisilkin-39-like [Biomphalaria glabrata]|uniref:Prisilkin-39-like n=1 Tax=Biomphalaria glabrata TaxID=6526 RepID=A0A9W3A9Q1_BIOGL|nr:prisilkin-39-like [Biomphalaria glabrata]